MANLVHWNPFKPLSRLESRPPMFEDLFHDFGLRPRWQQELEAPEMRIDVVENDQAYTVKAEIPGVEKDAIDVSVDGNLVSITAEAKRESNKDKDKENERDLYTERYYGQFYRSFSLPTEVDSGKAEAHYENGVLMLTLPKKANGSARKLAVS
ncbi:MAG: Hsp20/alpha crystallin family protein [Castellaniella sp.]|uniref:Hsp20/alpha crystallin family protein n=1 Tax=Castellaniella sp. TaxID=1955812 RepID=UPI0012145E2A|nr:Hsp20/alpha crystallin family protein [Castellaniella sp.]TAN25187.1 MAG: Hsp20/alpha crystallin family protein [Castellaniella sp.]